MEREREREVIFLIDFVFGPKPYIYRRQIYIILKNIEQNAKIRKRTVFLREKKCDHKGDLRLPLSTVKSGGWDGIGGGSGRLYGWGSFSDDAKVLGHGSEAKTSSEEIRYGNLDLGREANCDGSISDC